MPIQTRPLPYLTSIACLAVALAGCDDSKAASAAPPAPAGAADNAADAPAAAPPSKHEEHAEHEEHAKHDAHDAHAAEHADIHGGSAAAAPLRVEDLPPGLNPVQVEMRLLEDAMKHSLTIIANGDLQQLPPTIFAVHGARAETEKAVKEGRYRPPAKSDDIEGFSKTDTAFHDDLVRMVKAAKAGDRAGTAKAYGDVVNGCANCHAAYRPGFQ